MWCSPPWKVKPSITTRLSLTYEIEGSITPHIDPSTKPNTSLDRISSIRYPKAMLPKSTSYPVRNSWNIPSHCMPLTWTTPKMGYYQWVLQAADSHDDTGRCYNCNETGHKWKECTKPQCKGLKHAYERLQHPKGDVKKKGVRISRLGATVPVPAVVKA